MTRFDTPLTRATGIEVPLICGAMYPCSNWELVAAVSAAGGIGIVQPLTLVFVQKLEFREGLRRIRATTDRPIGMNVLTEKSSKLYLDRMRQWVDVALEEGLRFFVTSLGNPRWIVERVAPLGGVVYHDVTDRSWAQKALDAGVHGLIAVNNRAGGHAGPLGPERLYTDLHDLGVPVVCAGGIGTEQDFVRALEMGYAGVQMGTRFIATDECQTHPDYKAALVRASADDVVLTDKISGVPVAVLRTPYVDKVGTKAGFVARRLLRNPRTKHWMRMWYSLQSMWRLKQSLNKGGGYHEYWQAGKSVEGVRAIEPACVIVRRFAEAGVLARPATADGRA